MRDCLPSRSLPPHPPLSGSFSASFLYSSFYNMDRARWLLPVGLGVPTTTTIGVLRRLDSLFWSLGLSDSDTLASFAISFP